MAWLELTWRGLRDVAWLELTWRGLREWLYAGPGQELEFLDGCFHYVSMFFDVFQSIINDFQ